MTPLPRWMRNALLATAVMNLGGSFALTPAGAWIRAAVGMPDTHPLYPLVIATFVFLFGVGYLWTGVTGRADPLFIAIAAAGKLSFFGLLTAFWLAGDLPVLAPLAASGDLVFGVLFAAWLVGSTP